MDQGPYRLGEKSSRQADRDFGDPQPSRVNPGRSGRPASKRASKEKPTEPPRYAFDYKLTVVNAGSKAIKEIEWDYVFTDAATGEELGRREFTSVEKIGAGKRKELSVMVSSAPTRRISAYTLGKNER